MVPNIPPFGEPGVSIRTNGTSWQITNSETDPYTVVNGGYNFNAWARVPNTGNFEDVIASQTEYNLDNPVFANSQGNTEVSMPIMPGQVAY